MSFIFHPKIETVTYSYINARNMEIMSKTFYFLLFVSLKILFAFLFKKNIKNTTRYNNKKYDSGRDKVKYCIPHN